MPEYEPEEAEYSYAAPPPRRGSPASLVGAGGAAAAVAVLAVVFLWQPPHFYALAIPCREDYARAGIPMLPVVASLRRVAVETIVYCWLTVAATVALYPLGLGLIYLVPSLAVGALFSLEAHRMYGRIRRGDAPRPMRLFHWSTTYLTIVFVAIAVDALVHH